MGVINPSKSGMLGPDALFTVQQQSVSFKTDAISVPQGIVLVESKYNESFFSSSHLPVIGPRIDLNGHQSLLDDPSFPGQP